MRILRLEIIALFVGKIVVRLVGEQDIAAIARHVAMERDRDAAMVMHVAVEEHAEAKFAVTEKIIVNERLAVSKGVGHVCSSGYELVEPVVCIQNLALRKVDLGKVVQPDVAAIRDVIGDGVDDAVEELQKFVIEL